MLVALTLLAPALLRLEITLPKTIVSGQTVEAKTTVTNVSDHPVVLVGAVLPNTALGMRIKRTIKGPNGNVDPDERGLMIGQWFSGYKVPESAFFVLKPGRSRELYAESFSVRFLGERPSLISEYVEAPRAPLSPGTYRYRLAYHLTPAIQMRTRPFGSKEPDAVESPKVFSPEARRLFDACWGGAVETETTFTVVAKP